MTLAVVLGSSLVGCAPTSVERSSEEPTSVSVPDDPATTPASATRAARPSPSSSPSSPTSTAPSATASPAPAGSALAALAALRVAGRAPMTGYARERFGPAWLDADRNGCDTRNDVLRRDLRDVVLDPRTHGCVVLSGTLADPYTGRVLAFVRGSDGGGVDVDHVVALGNAWSSGAGRLDVRTRRRWPTTPEPARRRRRRQPQQGRR